MKYYVKFILIMLTLLLILPATGCGLSGALRSPEVHNLSVSESNDMINDNLKNPDFVILDVRTPAEYAIGYIPNAVNIDVEAADFDSRIGLLAKERTYLVYCRSGRRSLVAAEKMIQLGFTDVYNMLEGFNAWQAAGFPAVK